MGNPELELEREAGWEPVGLQAAAEAVQAEVGGDPAPSAAGQEPAAPATVSVPWDRMVGLVLDLVFGRLEKRDPLWTLAPAERSALVTAWSEYLATVAMAPGPLAGALLATGVVVGPRLAEDVQKRRKARTIDVEDRGQGAQ